ncbi:MAG: hypothetical protein M1587_10390 [Thaumarchaeota archaeon]|nr:hypothetical protein [Nitrososphaerota archaeon]
MITSEASGLSLKLKSIDEQLRSLIEEAETKEKEPMGVLKLEAVMKRYKFREKTVRRIHILERFNEKEDLEKYDRATEKGQRYCVVTIQFPHESSLGLRKRE